LNLSFSGALRAEAHTAGTPPLSSKPGAAYTIYLDFGGFNYTGGWAEHTPGVCPPFDGADPNGTFSTEQIERIKTTWAITASFYSAFNINVTTVDPAPAGLTDPQRQTFYLGVPNFMHTILTLPGGMAGGGASGLGTVVGTHNPANEPDTQHTNFIVFNPDYNVVDVANATAHENGHALGLPHQSDFIGETSVNEYCLGDTTVDGPNTGIGSYTAVMGGQNGQQRKTFRAGSSNNYQPGNFSNDVKQMLSSQSAANAASLGRTGGVDLRLVDDGIGHTLAAATEMPLNPDGTVNFSLASGVIMPASESDPIPLGAGNYTKDFFKFTLTSPTLISLTANNGTQYLTLGVADPGITLRSVLKIYDAAGDLYATATEDASTLLATYSGLLAVGTYYASVESYGGHHQVSLQNPTFEPCDYYDMGGYFLTGTGFATDPGSTPYALWAASKGLTTGNNGFSDNPDNDALDNLGEFAFDGNPLSGKNDGKIAIRIATVSGEQVLTLTLPVRTGASFTAPASTELVSAPIDGVYYHIQGSANLVTFGSAVSEITAPADLAATQGTLAIDHPLGIGWTYRSFRVAGPVTGAQKGFMRAMTTGAP
jgi:hypothetical protein